MRKYFATLLLAIFSIGAASAQVMTDAEVDSLSRAAATIMGYSVNKSVANLEGTGVIIDDKVFNKALFDALEGTNTGFTIETADKYIGRMVERMNQAYADQQTAFVDSMATVKKAKILEGGVVLITEKKGKGRLATAADSVKINYEGRLVNGTVFDHTTEPAIFSAKDLATGSPDARANTPAGATYRLVIPSSMAYGPQGVPGTIPGNSALDFTVTVLAIIPPTPTVEVPAPEAK